MRNKRFFPWLLLACLPFFAYTQEQLGLRNDNYAGINSVVLNPANNLTSKFRWDINLVEAGLFFDQNYGFIANTNLIDISQNPDNIQAAIDLENPNPNDPNVLLFDFFDNERPKFVSTNVVVMGPSFMVNLESGHTFGIFTRARAVVGGKGIPANFGYYNFERMLNNQEFSAPKFQMAGMTWSEIGLNYARKWESNAGSWGIGANVKILNGYESFYIANQNDFQITKVSGDSVTIGNLDLEYGFTTAAIENETFSTNANGTGFGVDLGAVFTVEDGDDDYRLKFGISVIDLGKIAFDRNTENHVIRYNGEEGINTNDFKTISSINQGTEQLSEILLGDGTLSNNPSGYGIWLPTAVSLQVDYKFIDMVYLNATLVQGIPMPGPALARDNILALSPRLEHRWFGIAAPVSLYNWQDFRIGTSLRFGFLTLGTDNLSSLVGKSTFTGSDFYLALKVNPFKINLGGGNGGGRGKNVRCYEF